MHTMHRLGLVILLISDPHGVAIAQGQEGGGQGRAGQAGMRLDESLEAISDALNQLAPERPSEPGTTHGLVPAEVTVVLQVSVAETEGQRSLVVLPSGNASSTGSTITVRFRSVAFTKDDELVTRPGALGAALDEIRRH